MKTRFFTTIVLVLFFSMQGMAQICIPKFKRIVEVTSKNINVRMEPNTKAYKLTLRDGNGQIGWVAPGLPSQMELNYLLIIDETAEWYHAYAIVGEWLFGEEVYVSKKACRTKKVKSIISQAKRITTGRYAGYYVVNGGYGFGVDMEGIVGKVVNGVGFGKVFEGEQDNIDDSFIDSLMNDQSGMTTILIPGKTTFSRQGVTFSQDWNLTFKLIDDEFHGDRLEF